MVKKIEKFIFHVISHTHWDREWYLPFETFRLELVELIDSLLDILEQNKEFIFHLDGQSIILQDYLEINPYKKEIIKKYIKSGNILIGPWYVLSDQFLSSGESTIRNLLYGIRDSEEFGNPMMVGYCPDQFGQIAQLPQILKGFNITSAVVGRGIQDCKAEHNWYALNGDAILAISLTHWYNNAQRFPKEKSKLQKYLEKIYNIQYYSSLSKKILLMNGCDHLFPQKDLTKILKASPKSNLFTIKQSSLPDAIEEISNSSDKKIFPIRFGELRDDNNKHILSGTLSTRVYLKLQNYKCQTSMEKFAEPVYSMLKIRRKSDYPYSKLKYAWRTLISNQAHDSICGCSTDDVHNEMETRFLKTEQVNDKLIENALEVLDAVMKDSASCKKYLQLINLTNFHRNDTFEANLEFPLGPVAEDCSAKPVIKAETIDIQALKKGNTNIGFQIVEKKRIYKMVRAKDEVPLLQAFESIKILFNTDIEPFSITSYEIQAKESKLNGHKIENRNESNLSFENSFYSLKINIDGTLSIHLKESDNRFDNIHFLSIEDDLGDEYNFISNNKSKPELTTKCKWNVKMVEENSLRSRFSLFTDDIADLDIEINITCYKGLNRIDFDSNLNNRTKNKRIRLHFPTNLSMNYINADTPYGVLLRTRPPITGTNYANSQPLHNWISHNDTNSGLAFLGNGLSDYELYEDGNGFAITLIRAVGKLSAVASHSLIQTPEAQCSRKIQFSYSIVPQKNKFNIEKINSEQIKFQVPILYNQSNEKIEFSSLIELFPQNLVISSLKRSEDNEKMFVLRFFNPEDIHIKICKLKLGFKAKKASLLNLNEKKIKRIEIKKDTINLEIKPYEIITLGFEI